MSNLATWKVIANFPNYEVSSEGAVRRVTPAQGTRVGKLLRPRLSEGYPQYVLANERRCHRVRVHVLVAEAFLPPRPSPKHEVAHWDNDRANPRLNNLRWATKKENQADRIRHGTDIRGEASVVAKLTEETVVIARDRIATGESYRSVAAALSVAPMTIWRAVNGKAWLHVGAAKIAKAKVERLIRRGRG